MISDFTPEIKIIIPIIQNIKELQNFPRNPDWSRTETPPPKFLGFEPQVGPSSSLVQESTIVPIIGVCVTIHLNESRETRNTMRPNV